MTVVVPLDGLTILKPGEAYSIDLEWNPDSDDPWIAKIRPWKVTDTNPPIRVEQEIVANVVTLEALPE